MENKNTFSREDYLNKYEISESVKEMENLADLIKEIENKVEKKYSFEREAFEFSNELSFISHLENDSKDIIMTRKEGIEKALESDMNINNLTEDIDREEIISVAQKSDRFEVISENQFINDIQDSISEKMKDEANNFGINVSNEIEFGDMNTGFYSVGMSELEESYIEGVNIIQNQYEAGDSSIIIDTKKTSYEEVREAIANKVIDSNKEGFEIELTGGKTFEEVTAELSK